MTLPSRPPAPGGPPDITHGTRPGGDPVPDRGGPGRLVLLTTTHRVAPGLLSWPAWQALHGADTVLCREADHPLLPYLADAGVAVEVAADGALPEAEELVAACAQGATVVVVAAAEGEPELTGALSRLAGSGRRAAMPELELLPGSYDLPGARLLDLVQVMDELREHCPWTSRRTHAELVPYGIEEAYELVEAIESGDRTELREELGDVLLQVVFHARIAEDDPEAPFSVDDVAGGIVEKLVRRHPHIYGEATAESAEDVKAHWLRTKAEEKQRQSVTEGVPLAQPGLALAAKLAGRARRAGLAVPLPTPEGETADGVHAPAAHPLGYRLLRLAAEAEAEGLDPEASLRAAARAYRDAIVAAEQGDERRDGADGADGADGL